VTTLHCHGIFEETMTAWRENRRSPSFVGEKCWAKQASTWITDDKSAHHQGHVSTSCIACKASRCTAVRDIEANAGLDRQARPAAREGVRGFEGAPLSCVRLALTNKCEERAGACRIGCPQVVEAHACQWPSKSLCICHPDRTTAGK